MDTTHLCYHTAQHGHKKKSLPVRLSPSRLHTGIDRPRVIMGSFGHGLTPLVHRARVSHRLFTEYSIYCLTAGAAAICGVRGHRLPDSPSVLTVCVKPEVLEFPVICYIKWI